MKKIKNSRTPKRGGLKKIADEKPICRHPEHDPPRHIVLSPGIYEYTCPGCGRIQRFRVAGVYM